MTQGWGRRGWKMAIMGAICANVSMAQAADDANQVVYQTSSQDSGSSTIEMNSGQKGDLEQNISVITPASYSTGPLVVQVVGGQAKQGSSWTEFCGTPTNLNQADAKALVDRIAQERGDDVRMAESLVQAESHFNHDQVSSKGAIGLTQLMPETAARLKINPCKPEENVRGGLAYFGQLKAKFGNPVYALAAYNAGPDRIDQYHGVPPYKETLDYVASILSDYYSRQEPDPAATPAGEPLKAVKVAAVKPHKHVKEADPEWKSGFVMNLD